MKTQIYTIDNPKVKSLLQQCSFDFYHVPEYLSLCCNSDDNMPFYAISEFEDNLFILPFICRSIENSNFIDATSPYGYSGPLIKLGQQEKCHTQFAQDAIINTKKVLAENGYISLFVRLHPTLNGNHISLFHESEVIVHGKTVGINLHDSEEQMWQSTRPTLRSDIRKLQDSNFHFTHDVEFAKYDEFIEIYHQTMSRVNASNFYFFDTNYFYRLKDILGKSLSLLLIEDDNEVICGALFSEFSGIVQYHLAGTKSDRLHEMPSKLLIHLARQWAKSRNNTLLHLGGGNGGSETDALFQFKSGFSKSRFNFATWRTVLNNTVYEKLSLGKVLDSNSTFFPIYRLP